LVEPFGDQMWENRKDPGSEEAGEQEIQQDFTRKNPKNDLKTKVLFHLAPVSPCGYHSARPCRTGSQNQIDAFINQGLPIAIGIMGFRLVG